MCKEALEINTINTSVQEKHTFHRSNFFGNAFPILKATAALFADSKGWLGE